MSTLEEFKFPDEKETGPANEVEILSEGGDVEIEVVDDTPERDRGRKPLDKEVADPTDDEIESYSDKVQARIKELTHARHDERRRKEELERQAQEMERLLQYMSEENKKLKQTVNYGQEVFIGSAKREAEAQLEAAKRMYKDAHESFDTDAIIAAQEALTDAKMRLAQISNYRPTPLQEENNEIQLPQSQPQQVQPDEKSLRWQARNQWYGSPGFEEYTSYALGLHHKLVTAGVDPRTDEYFAQIDERMTATFPELFGQQREQPSQKSSETSKKPAAVVAPASRSSGKKTIQLTPRQVSLAKKYGLTPQQYAAEVMKLEAQNG
jgi:hypothetical protein